MNRLLQHLSPNKSPPTGYYTYSEDKGRGNFAAIPFRVQYKGATKLLDGRVILFFGTSDSVEPRFQCGSLSNPQPVFAKDVKNISPGDFIEFHASEFSIPGSLGRVPHKLTASADNCYVQALINKDVLDPDALSCPGNLYSDPLKLTIPKDALNICFDLVPENIVEDDQVLSKMKHGATWLRQVSFRSELLSSYHKKDVFLYAGVILPKDYHNGTTAYPAIYQIEGFTGTESYLQRADAFLLSDMGNDWKSGQIALPCLRIVLGSRFTYGHTSFADGEVNGPFGSALTQEFIPYLESQFRIKSEATARFLTGHSSGGWSTLWLQIQYPHVFGGTWSSAPDPVDFTAFQLGNIYVDENAYWDVLGRPVPTSRLNGAIQCSVRDENLYERVVGRKNGGQFDAFFAIFGPRSEDGSPKPLFDKLTGDIDREVANYWRRYDICNLLLQQNGSSNLKDLLAGKIHVFCGYEDNYFLDRACRKLQEIIGKTSACGNYVQFLPGDHSTIKTKQFYTRVFQEIQVQYKQLNP